MYSILWSCPAALLQPVDALIVLKRKEGKRIFLIINYRITPGLPQLSRAHTNAHEASVDSSRVCPLAKEPQKKSRKNQQEQGTSHVVRPNPSLRRSIPTRFYVEVGAEPKDEGWRKWPKQVGLHESLTSQTRWLVAMGIVGICRCGCAQWASRLSMQPRPQSEQARQSSAKQRLWRRVEGGQQGAMCIYLRRTNKLSR